MVVVVRSAELLEGVGVRVRPVAVAIEVDVLEAEGGRGRVRRGRERFWVSRQKKRGSERKTVR